MLRSLYMSVCGHTRTHTRAPTHVGPACWHARTRAQAAGIRYIGFRNEQSAGYAAAAAGFLTGTPAVLLTVSGPGAVHGIAGLSHAQANCFPLIQVGACPT
jgi:thiamine pyrophosphate-dependent acetolactate synthase large subunit-like protein